MKDVIVILAGGINKDGTLPELPKQRVDEGVKLWRNGAAKNIIMSGKYGFWLDGLKQVPPRAEAEAMKEYAVSLGVPASIIGVEDDSKDTVGNAYFVKVNFLDKNNWKNIIVITSDFHIPRTKLIFDLVLGPDFNIEYIPTKHNFTLEERKKYDELEVKTIEVLKNIVGPIEPGDTEAVKNVLFTKHPGYAKNPEFTLEKLTQMLGRGIRD